MSPGLPSSPVRWQRGWRFEDGLRWPSDGIRMGDGVFETVRTYGRVPFELRAHLDRLRSGAAALALEGLPSVRSLEAEVRGCLLQRARRDGAISEWVLRPFLFAEQKTWGFHLSLDPLPEGAGSGRPITVGVSPLVHPGASLRPPGSTGPVKWISRGPFAYVLREARRRGWEEALLVDPKGHVIEGTRSNVFAVVDGAVISPGRRVGALPGITREVVLRLRRRSGFSVLDRSITPGELRAAQEVFLTSTLLGIAPVERIAGIPVGGGGAPGPVTAELMEQFQMFTRRPMPPRVVVGGRGGPGGVRPSAG